MVDNAPFFRILALSTNTKQRQGVVGAEGGGVGGRCDMKKDPEKPRAPRKRVPANAIVGAPPTEQRIDQKRGNLSVNLKNMREVSSRAATLRGKVVAEAERFVKDRTAMLADLEAIEAVFSANKDALVAKNEAVSKARNTGLRDFLDKELISLIDELVRQVKAEKIDKLRLVRSNKRVFSFVERATRFQDNTLASLKRLQTVVSQMNVGRQAYPLSDASMNPENFIPAGQQLDFDVEDWDDLVVQGDGEDEWTSKIEARAAQRLEKMGTIVQKSGFGRLDSDQRASIRRIHATLVSGWSALLANIGSCRNMLDDSSAEMTTFFVSTLERIDAVSDRTVYRHRAATVGDTGAVC